MDEIDILLSVLDVLEQFVASEGDTLLASKVQCTRETLKEEIRQSRQEQRMLRREV